MKLQILDCIHTGHLGITKCRSRARTSVWWPGLSKQIEDLVTQESARLAHTIPLLRSKRIGRLCNSEDPAVLAMVAYTTTSPALQKHLQARSFHGRLINTFQTLELALADQLHRSVDGRGLTPSALVPNQHIWIRDPPTTTAEHAFTEAIQVHGNLQHTSLRPGLRPSRLRVVSPIVCSPTSRVDSPTYSMSVRLRFKLSAMTIIA